MTQAKRSNKRKFTKKQVFSALTACNGCKIRTAEKLGCSRTTLDAYLAAFPELREAYEEISESKIDLVEDVLYQKAASGNMSAIMFFLRNLGKRRGYVEARPQTVFELTEKAKSILSSLKDGEITATEAALSFELEGLPIPDSVRLLLAKEDPEPVDPNADTYATISDEEMERRAAERKAQIAAQREGLDARRAEVRELRAEAADAFSEEAQEAEPRG